jgi:hypothetical protein
MRHGYGNYTWKKGDYEEGNWVYDNEEGDHIFINSDTGKIYTRTYKEGA